MNIFEEPAYSKENAHQQFFEFMQMLSKPTLVEHIIKYMVPYIQKHCSLIACKEHGRDYGNS